MPQHWPEAFYRKPQTHLSLTPTLTLTLIKSFLVFVGLAIQLPFDSGKADETVAELNIPGLIHSLEKIIKIKTNEFQSLNQQYLGQVKSRSDLDKIRTLEINPHFLSIVLLHADPKYLQLAQKGECYFYSLLENNLLKINQENFETIVVDYINEKNTWETATLSKNDFFQVIYQTKCINNKEIQNLFNLKNIHEPINKIPFPVPKSQKECHQILDQWKENPYTPYICRLSETFELAKRYYQNFRHLKADDLLNRRKYNEFLKSTDSLRSKISPFQYNYINNLCQNLHRPEKFCNKYLSDIIWDKVLNGERSTDHMLYRCQGILNKKSALNRLDLEKCKEQLEGNPSLCHYLNSFDYPALTPKPSCSSISKALNFSRLKSNYQDCPSRINNEGIVNTFRVINHFDNRIYKSNPENCFSSATGSFAKMVLDFGQENIWKFRLCYHDILEEKEICLPAILGEAEGSELSENKVLSRILIKSQGASEDLQCRILNRKDYRPHLLEFKKGCFVTYSSNNCNAMDCPKTIYLDQKEVKNIRYQLGTSFSYFPTNLRESQYAISSIMKKTFNLKSGTVKNLSELKFLLDSNKDLIIQGIGCAEDIFPSFHKKGALNQCRPLPFIVDGYFEENMAEFLIIRTAQDENHSPRIISWNYLFSAIKNYQELHPLKTWNLYVYKQAK